MKLGSVGAVSHTGDFGCREAGAGGHGGAVGGFVGLHLCVCVLGKTLLPLCPCLCVCVVLYPLV